MGCPGRSSLRSEPVAARARHLGAGERLARFGMDELVGAHEAPVVGAGARVALAVVAVRPALEAAEALARRRVGEHEEGLVVRGQAEAARLREGSPVPLVLAGLAATRPAGEAARLHRSPRGGTTAPRSASRNERAPARKLGAAEAPCSSASWWYSAASTSH